MTSPSQPKLALNPFAKSPTTRTRWIPRLSDSLRPTFTRLARELRLETRAKEAGQQNLPHKDDRDLDEAQRQVVAETQTGANLLKQFLANQLNGARDKLHGRSPRPLQVELLRAEANAAVSEAKLAHGATLEELRLAERRKLRDLRKFRADHRLGRDAAYADSRLLPVAMLCALILFEGIANAYIFQAAVNDGLVGGAIYALLFGTVNVLLGFLVTGYTGLRLIGHVKPLLRALGALFVLAGASAGFAWNLLVAHYREALERNLDAGAASIDVAAFLDPELLASPAIWFHLSSLEAWALLLFGLIIFAGAAYEGRGGRGLFDDPYPGYRAVHLAHREAHEAYSEAQADYSQAVRDAYAGVLAELHNRHAADADALDEIAEITDQAEERAAEVRDSVGEWRDAGMALLRAYRENNRAIRTAPAPAYFDAYPPFDELAANLADAAGLRRDADQAADTHAANATILARLEEELALARTRETEIFLAEIAAIEARAEQRLDTDWTDNATDAPARPRLITHNTERNAA